MGNAWAEGRYAYRMGEGPGANPYSEEWDEHVQWMHGYEYAETEDDNE